MCFYADDTHPFLQHHLKLQPLSSRDPEPSEGLGSSCQRTPIYKPFTQCRPPVECPPHPAPHSITEEELLFVKTCLQRWRAEVENDINGTPTHASRCVFLSVLAAKPAPGTWGGAACLDHVYFPTTASQTQQKMEFIVCV